MVRPLAQGRRHRDHRHDDAAAPGGSGQRRLRRRVALSAGSGQADDVLPATRVGAVGVDAAERRQRPTRSCSPARRSRARARPSSGWPASDRSRSPTSASRTRARRTSGSPRSAREPRTTRPLRSRRRRRSAGPIGATLYASSTTTDTEWVVQLSDVAPDGTATALTSGLLEGNQRALDPSMSWYGAGRQATAALSPVHEGRPRRRSFRARSPATTSRSSPPSTRSPPATGCG